MPVKTSQDLSDWLNYITYDEIELLKSVCRGLPDNPRVINIGAGAGTSGLAIMESRPDVNMTTIDITLEPSPYGCLSGERSELEKAEILPRAIEENRYSQIHGDSKEVGKLWEDGLVDFVFVDGDHSEAGAFGDIEIWLKNLKVGGVMAVHDYKKVNAWLNREGLHNSDLNESTIKAIKPWYWVDEAVDKLLVPFHKEIYRADALAAFEKLDE